MANIDKFLELFSEFDLVVTKSGKRTPEEVMEAPSIFNPTVQELRRSIKRLEREYNAAKRAWKTGKIQREELFDYEWRLFELKEELKKILGDDLR
jgi:predicted RNase H-like nuclease (RuvC/YqgF family)